MFKFKELIIVSYNLGHGVYNESYKEKLSKQSFNINNLFQATKEEVSKNILGQIDLLKKCEFDFLLLQESSNLYFPYFINQLKLINKNFSNYKSYYGFNSKIFNLGVGNQVLSKNKDADIQKKNNIYNTNKILQKIFLANKNFIIIKDKLNKLVIFNIHLIAFKENEEIRNKQLNYIFDIANSYYKDGYYVIIGGDWNINFANKNNNHYITSKLNIKFIEKIKSLKWSFAIPNNWTLRSLDNTYQETKKFAIVDAFLCSPNINIKEVKSLNNFKYSDHSPIMLKFLIK